MVKSTIKGIAKAQEEYPCLKESSNGNTVLFTRPKVGTVVHSQSGYYSIGKYSDEWIEYEFFPCRSRIVLENE